MAKPNKYSFGWLHGNGRTMLYVRRSAENPRRWGVTERFQEACLFDSIEACVAMWRSVHRFPDEYESCERDGYLHYFTDGGQRLIAP